MFEYAIQPYKHGTYSILNLSLLKFIVGFNSFHRHEEIYFLVAQSLKLLNGIHHRFSTYKVNTSVDPIPKNLYPAY